MTADIEAGEMAREAGRVLHRMRRVTHEKAPTGPTVRASERRMTLVAHPEDTTPNRQDDAQRDLPLYVDHFSTYVTSISPERAREILATLNWRLQRTVSERWVKDLRMAILKGELTFLTIVFAELPDQTRYLIDGQHRLRALSELSKAMPAQITVHRVADESELGKLYLTYDRSWKRGPEVGLRSMGVFEQTDLSEKVVRRMGPAVSIIASGFSRSYRNDNSLIDRSNAVRSWLPEIRQFDDAISGAPAEVRSKLIRGPVGAIALVTFKYQTGIAETFWSRTASQEMLGADDPRRRLLLWLREHTRNEGTNAILYCRYVSAAWNAFFENRKLKLLKVNDPSGPVRIAGTPYRDGGQ